MKTISGFEIAKFDIKVTVRFSLWQNAINCDPLSRNKWKLQQYNQICFLRVLISLQVHADKLSLKQNYERKVITVEQIIKLKEGKEETLPENINKLVYDANDCSFIH